MCTTDKVLSVLCLIYALEQNNLMHGLITGGPDLNARVFSQSDQNRILT